MNKLLGRFSAVAGALVLAAAPQAANAVVTITFSQNGTDVALTVAGDLVTTGLTRGTNLVRGNGSEILPSTARLALGSSGTLTRLTGVTGASALGTGALRTALSSYTGTTFEFEGAQGYIAVTGAFLSGGSFNGSGLFLNRTIAGLGLASGSYDYVWNGATQLTINVEPGAAAAVPEPAAWGLMLAGFGLVGAGLRARRRTAVTFA
jgi:hypothetical protein